MEPCAVTTQRYDTVTSRLSETKVAEGGTAHEWLEYGYDAGDLVLTIGDLRPGGLANRSFSYDALDRLTSATGPFLPGFASASLHYGFDAIGNLQCKDASALAGCTGGTQMLYPAAGQPRPHAPTLVYPASQGTPPALVPGYDAAGNLVALGTRAYAYDGLGRLTTARESGTTLATHAYDAGDRRVREDDRLSSRTTTRHFVRPDFEWDATRELGHIHVSLAGMNIATQVEPCDPPAAPAAMVPAVLVDPEPMSRETLLALVATPAWLGALLLLLQLALLRRRAQPLLRPALAGMTALAFYLSFVSPAWALPNGDVNADGHLDAADALLVHQISVGTRIPTEDELERADIAPLNQTPETTEPRVHPGDEALLWRALHGADVDGDQLTPDQELALGASPFRLDSDGDGVSDNVEAANNTALDDADTDGDGFSDSEEAAAGTDPPRGVVYRHGDHLGSTVLVTKATGTGAALVLERAVYLPFGGRVASSAGASTRAPEFGFTGQRYDNATNVYDYGARWHDPALGRFPQPDSIVPSPYASQSLNRYSYVRNNPLGRIDPSGNIDFGAIWGGVTSFFGDYVATPAGNLASSWSQGVASWWGDPGSGGLGFQESFQVSTMAELKVNAALLLDSGLAPIRRFEELHQSFLNATNAFLFAEPGVGTALGMGMLGLRTTASSFGAARLGLAEMEGAFEAGTLEMGAGRKAIGPLVFRQGTFADEAIGWSGNLVKGKQWAGESPLTTPNFQKRYGLPAENATPDWVVGGRISGDYRVQPAPASHNNPLNTGGAPEYIPRNPDDVILEFFHMPD